MLITATAMLVMGFCLARNTCLAKAVIDKKKEARTKRNLFKSAIAVGVFVLGYFVTRNSCNKIMTIADELKGKTSSAPHHQAYGRQLMETAFGSERDVEEMLRKMDEAWDTMMDMKMGKPPNRDMDKPEQATTDQSLVHNGFGMCPVILILIVIQSVYLYLLQQLKKRQTSIRVLTKAKELAINKSSANRNVDSCCLL